MCSSVHTQSFCFFSNFLRIFMFADKFSMCFDRYWIAPRNDFNSFSFFGRSNLVIASNLSWIGLMPCWSILCPPIRFLFWRIHTSWGLICTPLVPVCLLFLVFPLRVYPCFLWRLLLCHLARPGVCAPVLCLFLEYCWNIGQSVKVFQETVISFKISSSYGKYA